MEFENIENNIDSIKIFRIPKVLIKESAGSSYNI